MITTMVAIRIHIRQIRRITETVMEISSNELSFTAGDTVSMVCDWLLVTISEVTISEVKISEDVVALLVGMDGEDGSEFKKIILM